MAEPKLVPFDPKKHKAVDAVSLGIPNAQVGEKATEYEATEVSPDNQVWNIPTIRFDVVSGQAALLPVETASRVAAGYEQMTGKKFPRFGPAYIGNSKNVSAFNLGATTAEKRSSGGGATQGSLTDSYKPRAKSLLKRYKKEK